MWTPNTLGKYKNKMQTNMLGTRLLVKCTKEEEFEF